MQLKNLNKKIGEKDEIKNELQSLKDFSQDRSSFAGPPFNNVNNPYQMFWSSSTDISNPDQAWYVSGWRPYFAPKNAPNGNYLYLV